MRWSMPQTPPKLRENVYPNCPSRWMMSLCPIQMHFTILRESNCGLRSRESVHSDGEKLKNLNMTSPMMSVEEMHHDSQNFTMPPTMKTNLCAYIHHTNIENWFVSSHRLGTQRIIPNPSHGSLLQGVLLRKQCCNLRSTEYSFAFSGSQTSQILQRTVSIMPQRR